jgi:hypothetical protein
MVCYRLRGGVAHDHEPIVGARKAATNARHVALAARSTCARPHALKNS